MLEVMNLVSNASGRATVNQFDICRRDESSVVVERVFQSYKSPCAKLERSGAGKWERLTIYEKGFYSRTTAKWLRVWLEMWLPMEDIPGILKAAREAVWDGSADCYTVEL